MNKGKKKRRKKGIRICHIIILFLIVYVSMIFINQKKLKSDLSLKQMEIEKEIEALQDDIGGLNLEVEKRGTIEFLENAAREELGMVKPNEIIYIDKGRVKNSIFNFFKK